MSIKKIEFYLYSQIAFATFFLVGNLYGSEIEKKAPKICLNMIVKNESKVIERCLRSAKPLIDYWVIVDTGSTDGTQEIIKKFMKDIPGELHEVPWVNFEYNRNKALEFAKGKGDYVLFIDADEQFQVSDEFDKASIDKDCYQVKVVHGGTDFTRVLLIKNSLDWKWVGVVHEVPDCPDAKTSDILKGLVDIVSTDGARSSDPLKYHKDAQMLEEALAKDPDNTRYVFYLAQSYRDAGEHEKSLQWYTKRIEMGGWDQEVYWSKLQVARLQESLKQSPETVLASFHEAFQYRPSRAEPLYSLANYSRMKSDFATAYLIASVGCNIPISNDVLFVERAVYDWGLPLELSVAAYWIGKYDECEKVSLKILEKPNVPQHIRDCVQRNLDCSQQKLRDIRFANSIILNQV